MTVAEAECSRSVTGAPSTGAFDAFGFTAVRTLTWRRSGAAVEAECGGTLALAAKAPVIGTEGITAAALELAGAAMPDCVAAARALAAAKRC